jgi:hypothetical protein
MRVPHIQIEVCIETMTWIPVCLLPQSWGGERPVVVVRALRGGNLLSGETLAGVGVSGAGGDGRGGARGCRCGDSSG